MGVEYPSRGYVWTDAYREGLERERIRLVTTDLISCGLPFRARSFDLVTFAGVIEHLPPQTVPGTLAEMCRVLAPGGALLVTTPNLASWYNRELLLRGDSPGTTEPRIVMDGSYGHLRLYTMAELVTLLEGAGFQVIRRGFFDQLQPSLSALRRMIRVMLAPVKAFRPAIRDTCVIHAVSKAQ